MTKENSIEKVWKEKGVLSEEFYNELKGFVEYLLLRYKGKLDEDVVHDCYIKIQRSLRYYDPEKGGYLSFLYSVIKYVILNKNKVEIIKKVVEEESFEEEIDNFDFYISKLKYVRVSDPELFRRKIILEGGGFLRAYEWMKGEYGY